MTDLTNAAEKKTKAIALALEIVSADAWSGDTRVNMTTALGAGRVIAQAYTEQAAELAELRGKLAAAEGVIAEMEERAVEIGDVHTPEEEILAATHEVETRAERAVKQLAAFADPTPVDEAWCNSNSGRVYNGQSAAWELPNGITVVVYLKTGLVMIEVATHAVAIMNKATRGQLAKLLSTLGAT